MTVVGEESGPFILVVSCVLVSSFFVVLTDDLTVRCKGDGRLRSEVELAIYHFPGVVTAAHKRRDTPPHCIFAVDNLVRTAVNEALSVLSPGEMCGQL